MASNIQFELERLYDLVKETQEERDGIRMELEEVKNQNKMMRDFIKKAEHESYVLKHQLESINILYKTTYEYLQNIRKEKNEMEKQLKTLTDGSIKYKRCVDPDDLEEYTIDHKSYLRDMLTDAIYNKKGKLVGYIDEDSGKLVQVIEPENRMSVKRY
jgi:chromosome segregation ATPase